MKPIPVYLALLLAFGALEARGSLLLYEPFAYPNIGTAVSSNTPANWSLSGNGANDSDVAAGSLSVNGAAAPVGNSMASGASGQSLRRLIGATTTNGTLYFSVLFRMNKLGTDMTGTNQICALMASDDATFGTTVCCRSNGAGYSFSLQRDGNSSRVDDNAVYTDGQTVLLAGNYTFIAGATNNDSAMLWINPSSSTFGAALPPPATLVTGNGTDVTDIDRFNFRQSGTNSSPAVMQWDELRIGTNWADVTPTPTTGIALAPASVTTNAGATVVFTVGAVGTAPLTFQWLKNGTNLSDVGNASGTTTSALTLTNVLAADAASYTVQVTGAVGPSVLSSPAAVLTVRDPAIILPPAGLSLPSGSNAVFSVVAAGTPPLIYRWKRFGTNLLDAGNISGSTTATLTVSNISMADVGTYTVGVTNTLGSTNASAVLGLSDPALLLYESFNYAGVGGLVSTNNPSQWVLSGGGADDAIVAAGSLAVSGLTPAIGNSLATGASGRSLRRLLGSTNSVGTLFFSVVIRMDQIGTIMTGTNQICAFTASDNATFGTTVLCRTNGVGYSFGLQKDGATGRVNDSTVFTNGQTVLVVGSYAFVPGSGSDSIARLWLNPAPTTFGATSAPPAMLTTSIGSDAPDIDRFNFRQSSTNTVPAAMTWDELRVGTTWGDVTPYQPTSILIAPSPLVTNAGSVVVLSVLASGAAPLVYQWLKNGTNLTDGGGISGSTTATLTLSNVLAANSGNYTVQITGVAGHPAVSFPASLNVVDPSITAPPNNQQLNPGATAKFTVTAAGTLPLHFQWQRYGTNLLDGANISGSQNPTLTINSVSAPDATLYTVVITNAVGVTNAAANLGLGDPIIVSPPSNHTVNFGTNLTLTVTAAGTAPFFYHWQKAGTNLFDTGNVSGSLTTNLTLSNVAFADAADYRVVVTNSAGSVTSSVATLTVRDPIIVIQLTNQTVASGGHVVFTVVAAGTAPLNYLWERGATVLTNGGNIAGATTATLTLNSVSQSDATNGSYSVVVGGAGPSATSSPAALTVTDFPTISAQPLSQTNGAGNLVTFAVAAAGNALNYQWQFGGSNIAGATKSTLLRTNVQAADAGQYSVVITNLSGGLTSSNAWLTVIGDNSTRLALWDFNSLIPDTNVATGVTTPAIGSGQASVVGALPTSFNDGSDSDLASLGSDNSGWELNKSPTQGTSNKLTGFEFKVSTSNYFDIIIAWQQRISSTASKYCRFQYTTNGATYLDGPVITMSQANNFEFQTVDLSIVPGVNNNTNFGFRIAAEFQSTATSGANNNYVTATTNAYATSGTVRFDMIDVFGSLKTPPLIKPLVSAGPNSLTLAWTSIPGLVYRVQYTADLGSGSWTNLPPDITATTLRSSISTQTSGIDRRFYRVILLP